MGRRVRLFRGGGDRCGGYSLLLRWLLVFSFRCGSKADFLSSMVKMYRELIRDSRTAGVQGKSGMGRYCINSFVPDTVTSKILFYSIPNGSLLSLPPAAPLCTLSTQRPSPTEHLEEYATASDSWACRFNSQSK